MQIAFALIAIFWWISVWGLFDIATEEWSRESKIKLYVGMLVVISMIVLFFPEIVKRF
jgi:hypothetical protein